MKISRYRVSSNTFHASTSWLILRLIARGEICTYSTSRYAESPSVSTTASFSGPPSTRIGLLREHVARARTAAPARSSSLVRPAQDCRQDAGAVLPQPADIVRESPEQHARADRYGNSAYAAVAATC